MSAFGEQGPSGPCGRGVAGGTPPWSPARWGLRALLCPLKSGCHRTLRAGRSRVASWRHWHPATRTLY